LAPPSEILVPHLDIRHKDSEGRPYIEYVEKFTPTEDLPFDWIAKMISKRVRPDKRACQQNFKTRFVSGYALANELIKAYDDRDLSRIVNRYKRFDLLVLDELGYVPFSKEGAELLFQVLAERHEQGSIIITTNLGFADWTKIFGDPNMTAALLDRLSHNAHIIECDWDSYRLKQSLRNGK